MKPCAHIAAACAILAGGLLAGAPAMARPAAPASPASGAEVGGQGDLSLTIYNSGPALVQDVRQIEIARGRSTVPFRDVSAMIRPETLSFAAEGTAILEQNFDFDLLTPEKLMEKAVGQEVTLIRTNPATGAEIQQRAQVLSTIGGVVIRVGGRIEVLRDDGLPVRVIFDEVPANLRARPTLSVTLESERAGPRTAAIRYLTPGLGWSADYVALFDEGRGVLDLQGWVTLTNTTGTTFADAGTLLVAGNPGAAHQPPPIWPPIWHRNGPGGGAWRGGGGAEPFSGAGPAPTMAPGIEGPGIESEDIATIGIETAGLERLGDFHLYPLPARTTIANNQTKQVGFLDVQSVPARRVYSAVARWLASDAAPRNATSAISFSSTRDGARDGARTGGLGDALPAGTVRFYQRDRAGTPQFIGENAIGHTPMGTILTLETGAAFDVLVQAEAESRTRISAAEYARSARLRVLEAGAPVREVEVERALDHFRTTMRYTLTNARPEPVEVELRQEGLDHGPLASDWRVVSEDVPGEQINAGTRLYRISVPANGARQVRVTYETRF